MSCTINFIVLLLIKTYMVSFCETVRCQCQVEILLIGKFIRINTCREGKSGTKFSWCLEGRRLLWALGDVVCCLLGGVRLSSVIGVGFFSVWTCRCCSGVTLYVCRSYHLTKEQVFMLQET